MKKYKGYNKQQTSDKQMRIDKREPILAYIVAQPHKLMKLMPKSAENLHRTYGKVKGNEEWQFANTVSLEVCHNDYAVFSELLDFIDETGWLKTYVDTEDNARVYFDTRKLRTYYNWTHRGPKQYFYIERILKYFYTNTLFTMYLNFHDALNRNCRSFTFSTIEEGDVAEIGIWLKDVHGITASVDETSLVFNEAEFEKFLKFLD